MPELQPNSDMLGRQIGNYLIEALLGSGGMGQVFRARHLLLERQVALKLMHANLARDAIFQARFLHEARAAANLRHPHIVEVFDFDNKSNAAYLVMELVTGGSLRHVLMEQSFPQPAWAFTRGVELVRQAAEALAYAHTVGMVHRDIKPDNLLLQPGAGGGEPICKVGDFGLVRLGEGSGITSSSRAMGTPAYMSPEQCQGHELDGRSDIYALGVVLFELITGRLPFLIDSVHEAVFRHVYTQPPLPSIFCPELPPVLEAVVLRCMAKLPAERYSSASELADVLRSISQHERSVGGAIEHHTSQPAPAIPERLLPRLEVYDDQGQLVNQLALRSGSVRIGRIEANELQLSDPQISRHHLQVNFDGAQVVITDLGSRSGTQLGSNRLAPQVPTTWPWDEVIRIGSYWLRAVTPDHGMPAPAFQLHHGRSTDQPAFILEPLEDLVFVLPGQPNPIDVIVRSLIDTPQLVACSASGLPDGWISSPRPTQLGPGQPVALRWLIQPPFDSTARAGEYPIEVRIRSQLDPGLTAMTVLRCIIRPFSNSILTLEPYTIRRAGGRSYKVLLRNNGNNSNSYRLSVDYDGRLASCVLHTERVMLDPGQSATIQLDVEVPKRSIGDRQSISVTVRAQNSEGEQVRPAVADFIDEPLIVL